MLEIEERFEVRIPDTGPTDVDERGTVLRAAYILSGCLAALMVVASGLGLAVHGLYHDGAWGREALRGGDLVTLVLVAPAMIAALVFAVRGSPRAQAILAGTLAYAAYNYAYYTFGAAFNDIFILHIACLSISVFGLACIIPSLDARAIASTLRADRAARWIGSMLVVTGLLQGALWVFVVVRYAMTGTLLHDIPVSGQHLVFALDLALLVPSLVLAGVLLFRRSPMGYVLGAVMVVMGAAYQVNLMVSGAFQDAANVAGVKAFPPEAILLTTLFAVSAVVLLRPRRTVR